MNRQHRLAPAKTLDKASPANQAAGQFLLITMLTFCAAAWLLMQWGSTQATNHTPAQGGQIPPAAQGTTAEAQPPPVPVVPSTSFTNVAVPPTSETPYNTDLWGTLLRVVEQEGQGLLLISGSVLGGGILLLLAVRHITHIPKDPLATGLVRTLTLLENNQRAGNLTPQRALEVARQAVAELEQLHAATLHARTQEYETAIRTRSREYEQATAQLTKTHTETVAAIQAEATRAVHEAQAERSRSVAETTSTLQRLAHNDAQVQQLSRDLATTHEQLVQANTLARTQAEEIADLTQALEEATDTLVEWQAAHKALAARHTTLTEAHATLEASLQPAQETVREAKKQAEQSQAEAQSLREAQTVLTQEKSTLTEQLGNTNKELARLRSVNLRELPLVIPDREGDLAPHLASLVAFIRGTTLDTGAAGGERTTKPILSSWRDIRRLLQVLKGVGVRLAVPAHHLPAWASEASGEISLQAATDAPVPGDIAPQSKSESAATETPTTPSPLNPDQDPEVQRAEPPLAAEVLFLHNIPA